MLERVKLQPYVTFVGVSGSGKTATVHHIALKLQQKGYEILPIIDINKIEDYCDPHKPQVFVIDDVLGVYGFDMSAFNVLSKYEERITNPTMPKTKFLMTCREVVYRNEALANTFFSKKNNVVLLNSDDNALTNSDKYCLLAKYNLNTKLLSLIDVSQTSKMFPFLCKIFSKQRNYKVYGPKFFISPIPVLLEALSTLRQTNATHYASLVLLTFINQSKLSKEFFDKEKTATKKFEEIEVEICEKCKVQNIGGCTKLTDVFKELEGSYTISCGNQFTFIHDSMIEILAFHFGSPFPKLILQYMSSNYIANYIKVSRRDPDMRKKETEIEGNKSVDNKHSEKIYERENEVDLCINVVESDFTILAERLFRDVGEREFYNVFEKETLKNPGVYQAFIGVMQRKPYDVLHSVFLSELEETPKLCENSFKRVRKYSDKKNYHIAIHSLLKGEEPFKKYRKVRAISWVIYYGHYEILKHIVYRIKKEKGNVDELFENSYNKDHRPHLINMQDDIVIEQENVDHYYFTEHSTFSRGCCARLLSCFGGDPNLNHYIDNDTNTESNVEMHPLSERMIAEQWRLLFLGCNSGDLDSVHLLLKYVSKDAINFRIKSQDRFYRTNDPLVITCEFGNLNIVKALIEAGYDINNYFELETPLTTACKNGHSSIVKELLNKRANVNQHSYLSTPLIAACESGHMDVINELLLSGVDVNLKYRDETPLTTACEKGNYDVIKLLIKSGACASPVDNKSLKCYENYLSVIEKLVNLESNDCLKDTTHQEIDMTEPIINLKDESTTNLIVACYNGYSNEVEKMIKTGIDVNLKNKFISPLQTACYEGHLSIVIELINAGAYVNTTVKEEIALTIACFFGYLSIVKVLIKFKAELNLSDGSNTPLTAACYTGRLEVVKELLNAWADVNQTDGHKTPLTTACDQGHPSVVEYLISMGANVNQSNGNKTPLTTACERGHSRVVYILIKYGADVNQNDGENTPLTAACSMYNGHCSIIDELIKHGADVNLSDGVKTPLIATCYRGHFSMINRLIKSGADINQREGWYTPLISACSTGHLHVVKELIKAGVDVNLPDSEKTPLEVARTKGHKNIVGELSRAGAHT